MCGVNSSILPSRHGRELSAEARDVLQTEIKLT